MYRLAYRGAKARPTLTRGKAALALLLCLTTILLAGCGIRINLNQESPDVEELPVNQDLAADPVLYNEDGKYEIVFHYDKGGFEKMDLSQAYVAYYGFTVQDQINTILGEDLEDLPPLPEDAQFAFDQATDAMELRRIARINIRTLNDNTLRVSFRDRDDPIPGREYFFVIPSTGLGGSVIPN